MLADELAQVLFALDVRGLTTRRATQRITRAILGWAVGRGWIARTEARVTLGATSTAGELVGFVDVVIRRGGSLADVVIEIDSTDKPWSLVKLKHAAAGGMHAIWIRWGEETWAGAHEDVDVIQLPIQSRVGRRSGHTAQTPLWSR